MWIEGRGDMPVLGAALGRDPVCEEVARLLADVAPRSLTALIPER